jgi:hypothetical protein
MQFPLYEGATSAATLFAFDSIGDISRRISRVQRQVRLFISTEKRVYLKAADKKIIERREEETGLRES